MSEWLDQYRNHTIHEVLKKLKFVITQIKQGEGELSTEGFQKLDRMQTVIIKTQQIVNALKPELINFNHLNNLDNHLSRILSELNNFYTNRNEGHLTNANTHIENVLVSLANIHFATPSNKQKEVKESLDKYKSLTEKYIKELEARHTEILNKFNALKGENDELKETIVQQEIRLDNAIAQYQKQFSDSENVRRTEFDEKQKIRDESFEEIQSSLNKQVESIIEENEEKLGVLYDTHRQDGDSSLQYLNEQKEKAEKIVQVIAATGMTGGFQRVANSARKSKYLWQTITVVALLGLISFAVVAFLETVGSGFDFGKFGARAFVAFSFGVLAAYAARQADKNSEVERKNRKIELEFATIEPYLSNLPEETQHKLKEELAKKWFGQGDDNWNLKKLDKTEGNFMDIIKMLFNLIPKGK